MIPRRPNISAASSFRTIEEAETFISRGLISNAPSIQAWATTARPGERVRFLYEAGETVGYGVVRGQGSLQNMSKVRIVIRKLSSGSKMYFLLTSFPEP